MFAFHRPEFLNGDLTGTATLRPDALRGRLQNLTPLNPGKLWGAQIEAVTCLEASLAQNQPEPQAFYGAAYGSHTFGKRRTEPPNIEWHLLQE